MGSGNTIIMELHGYKDLPCKMCNEQSDKFHSAAILTLLKTLPELYIHVLASMFIASVKPFSFNPNSTLKLFSLTGLVVLPPKKAYNRYLCTEIKDAFL